MDSHGLKQLLQLQLGSDASAALHLPFVLETLTKQDFLPSPHTQKWIARINSLIHSKNPGAKWSGLCLALQTATFSRDIMLECAQSWVGAAMPLLTSISELLDCSGPAPPTTKAAIRLLRHIFSSAMNVPEFQRQLSIPNVPKFANALIAIIEKQGIPDVILPVLDALAHVVSLYPSLCRPLHGSLSNIALRSLNGSAPTPTSRELLEASSKLYATLSLTGGKVNAPNLWRKSLDDTIAFAWGAFLQLRTTYPTQGYGNIARPEPPVEDPIIAVPLALDRLRAAVRILEDLFSVNASRPVMVPVNSIVRLCLAFLRCSLDDKADAHVDHAIHSLESSVVPNLWALACELISSLSQACRDHLNPHLTMLLTHLAFHLERHETPTHTLSALRAVVSLLTDGARVHESIIACRLARAIMPFIAKILTTRSQNGEGEEQGVTQGRSKKAKKRARGYEGDEVFKVGREVVCLTTEDGDVLLTSVDVLDNLLSRTPLRPPVRSIATRLLLSIYGSLPQLPPALISSDLSLHSRLCAKIQRVCVRLAIGTTNTMSKSLGFVLSISDGTYAENGELMVPTEVELLLHPRVPPLVRSLPHVEMLSLFRAEEGDEESDARSRVGLRVLDDRPVGQTADIEGIEAVHKSSAPFIPTKVAESPGEPFSQERSITAMQVDVPAAGSTAPNLARPPESPIKTHASTSSARPPQYLSTSLRAPEYTLPPPPDPLPSNSVALGAHHAATTTIPPMTHATPGPAATGDDNGDDDEPMPTIDLGSDSDPE
ncbi:rRNA processing/ribosome biogenesis-domain-containing protein [Daedaleopsis nitida]|nr:rRNA processing/ribosome biogenesis-domain-containing protein [Daedaleopsis nitida]